MNVTVKMYTCDVPDRNGVIIPKEVMEKAVDEYMKNDSSHIVSMETPDTYMFCSLNNAIGTLKDIKINENGEVYGTINVLHTPKGKVFNEIFSKVPEQVTIVPMGTGEIEDMKYTHIDLTHFNVEI